MHTDSVVNWILEDTTYLSQALQRNFNKWDEFIGESIWIEPEPIPQSYEEEISTMINWITNRLNWMDSNMPGDCANDTDLSVNEMNTEFNLYPNPARDVIYIKTEEGSTIRLCDIQGKLLTETLTNNKVNVLNVSAWSPGTYFIHTKTRNTNRTHKILIQ